MIRINLLPGPKGHRAKPQYDVRAQALLGVGLLLITLAGCWWYAAALNEKSRRGRRKSSTRRSRSRS